MILVAKSKKNRRRRIRIITASIILSIVFIGIIILFISLGYYVSSLNTIYPNVWAEGVDVSELTIEQARQALIDSGYEERASGISLTVTLPYAGSFTVTGDEVGLKLSANEAAWAAYNYGRDGSFFANEIAFIRAHLGITELTELSHPNYDTSALRVLAEEYAILFNDSLYGHSQDVSDNYVMITKGTGYLPVTSDEIYDFAEMSMRRAIENNEHLEVKYMPQADTEDTIDIAAIFRRIHNDPVSSVYDPELGNPESIRYDPVNLGATESRDGRTFDLQAALEMYDNADNGATILIPIVKLEPEVSREELKSRLFRDILGEREAWQSSPADRATNIRLASEAIDGTILQPGDVFSYNATVGQRTAEKGYRLANAYVSGELVPEIGGGICQVSSTIYAALIQTDIEIVSQMVHGSRVGYLPGGQDATIAWPNIDFKFRNNTDYPIKLEVITSGSITVSVKIYGTRVSDVYYEVKSVEHPDSPITMTTIEREATEEDEERIGRRLEPGESVTLTPGNAGSIWEVWRYHYSDPELTIPILDSNGEHVKKLYSKETYRMRQRVIIFNTDNPRHDNNDD